MTLRLLSAFLLGVLACGISPAQESSLAEESTGPIAERGLVFAEKNGIVAVEAEHFVSQSKTNVRAWYRIEERLLPDVKPDPDGPHLLGASGASYLEALSDTRATHGDKIKIGESFFPKPGMAGVLTYRVHIETPGRYYVWVRHLSTGSEDNGLHVGLDDKWPESGQRWQTTKRRKWAWESRQRTREVHTGVRFKLYLDIETAGEHRIHFSMREDGFEFDKFVLASNRDYVPEGSGPQPIVKSGRAPAPRKLSADYTEAPIPPAAKGSKLIRPPAGRLAIVADGNSPDPDDIGATAVIFGLLKASGLSDRLVHLSHSCDLKPTTRIPADDELRRQKVMDQVCRQGVAQFGPFRNLSAWFNCRTQQEAAVNDLRDAINKSSKDDPLWIIEAGEPDVIGYALKAADASKREYVHVVSHHPANDDAGDFFTWQQILDYGVKEHQIGDQNVGLKTATTAWDWAKNHKLPGIRWIWKQLAYAEQDGVVKFQTNHFDCSDAGMVYWWITGADGSGNKRATPVEIATMLKQVQPHVDAASRPSILLIVADDVGYSDLGCYGGEIDTPRLDRLASEGIRFSEFHVNPMCVVTRTSLMTGHTHSQSDNYRRSIPVARLMRDAGYATSISGKWHQPGNPLDAGFDSFYGFLGGAIDSWTGIERGKPAIQSNRQKPRPVPKGWYSSDAFTDDAIKQIDAARKTGKPFFTYLAYNAPHSPLHAPRENVEKYYDRYLAGWESLRQQRFKRMKAMGLIDDRYVMSQPEAEVRRWDELPASIQKQESRRMAAYAGMLNRLDWNVGRLLKHLEEQQLADNTLVIFMADNGGAYSNGDIRTYDQQIPWKAGTNPFASNGWSYLKNTPFRWYKSCAQEGGISVPMIVRWPERLANQAGTIRKQRLHATDLYPTFLELAGASYPATDGNRHPEPLYGRSLVPLLNDATLPHCAIHDEIFWCFNQTGKGLTKGDWKISSVSDGPWRLYNISNDPAESKNLAGERPELVTEMSRRWFDFAANRTAMPASWRALLKDYQEGWGFHRIRMSMPAFIRAVPASSAMDVPCDTDLSFHFSQPISFANSEGKTLRLYEAGDVNTIVWQADPQPGHPAEGTKQITFDDLPGLKPNTTYFALADSGWITIGNKPAGPLNDGAFWYRFRTGNR